MSYKCFKLIFLVCLSLSYPGFTSDTFNKQAFVERLKADENKVKDKFHERLLTTLSCDDCEYIPKVADAGKIFTENGVSYQLMHNGIKIIENCYCYVKGSTWVADIIAGLRGHHEPQEEKVFHEVLKFIPSGATMIELGSWWGYYSMWFNKSIPNAKNYLIEPVEKYLETGKKNFELNNLKGNFFRGYAGNGGFGGKVSKRWPLSLRVKIDDFLEQQGIDHLNILHSDIQGSEFVMLQDCQKSIDQNKIDYFFISTHSKKIHIRCLNFLKQKGFTIVAEHSPAQSFSCDGLVVGKRPGAAGPDTIEISKREFK